MVAGLLLMILAFQMIADRGPACPGPSAPHRRPSLVDAAPAALVQRAVPLLRYIENVSHPSWHSALEATKRLVGIVIFILAHREGSVGSFGGERGWKSASALGFQRLKRAGNRA
jgi:hypothetical protein